MMVVELAAAAGVAAAVAFAVWRELDHRYRVRRIRRRHTRRRGFVPTSRYPHA